MKKKVVKTAGNSDKLKKAHPKLATAATRKTKTSRPGKAKPPKGEPITREQYAEICAAILYEIASKGPNPEEDFSGIGTGDIFHFGSSE